MGNRRWGIKSDHSNERNVISDNITDDIAKAIKQKKPSTYKDVITNLLDNNSTNKMLYIRKSEPPDADQIWEILAPIIKAGDAFTYAPSSSKADILDYWLAENKHTYTAFIGEQVVGTFFIQDNQPGLGAHVANAGYATAPNFYGRGIAREMCRFSLEEARRLGYLAMQFNIVVKTNARAVALWQQMGFDIIGEIPDAFQHQQLGLVNAYIMYQKL